jgi:ABC-type sugar transport system ATPase subunit
VPTLTTVDANPTPAHPAIRISGLSKSYPGVQALASVDFSVAPGEVRALLGKNGAGKSTLVETMSGALQPDSGGIEVDGRPVTITSPAAARAHGIATVHQELTIAPELSVAENVFLGRWRAVAGRGPFIVERRLIQAAAAVLARLDVAIDPRIKVGELSIAHQQMVEIARAVSTEPRVLILDEPTSSLATHEVDVLIALVRRLARAGVAIVYVSHRMDEIPRVADTLTVLRDGRLVSTVSANSVSTSRVVELMTGGKIHHHVSRSAPDTGPGRKVLEVKNLSAHTGLRDITLAVHEGEVLGLAGLLGSGRTELLNCLAGVDRFTAGGLTLRGKAYAPRSVRGALRHGIGIAPEDRKKDGVALHMSVGANVSMACPDRIRRLGLLSRGREARLAEDTVMRLHIKVASIGQPVRGLSGGNQQKVVLGKCLNAGSTVLLLDEPTRGVDVEAKEQIYRLIRDLAKSGASIVVASSEIEELFLVCDRIVSMKAGQVISIDKTSDTTLSAVLAQIMEGRDND